MEPTFEIPERRPSLGLLIGLAALGCATAGFALWWSARRQAPATPQINPGIVKGDWEASIIHLAQAMQERLVNDEQMINEHSTQIVGLRQMIYQLQNGGGGVAPATVAQEGPVPPAATSMVPPDMPAPGKETLSINSNPEVGATEPSAPQVAAVSM